MGVCRTFETVDEAYLGVLHDVHHNYEFLASPRGLPIREILNYQFTILKPVAKSVRTKDAQRNQIIREYLKKERALYASGTNRVGDFAKAASFWERSANPDGTVNSAYGFLIWFNTSIGHHTFGGGRKMTPWEWARKCLEKDKETRRAILRFSLPEHQWFGNNDHLCTMHGHFLIRNDTLYLTITMRANDVVRGLPYDMPWFISLLDRMHSELQKTYPNLQRGTYTHIAHSMHMYERDAEKVRRMLGEQSE